MYYSGWFEWNFDILLTGLFPIQNILDILLADFVIITVSDGTFK
jgi:hypothetical protein